MDDRVTLINAIAADDTDVLVMHDNVDEVKLMVTRNMDHLEIQIATDWYSDSSVSKALYTGAVTAGKAYVAA